MSTRRVSITEEGSYEDVPDEEQTVPDPVEVRDQVITGRGRRIHTLQTEMDEVIEERDRLQTDIERLAIDNARLAADKQKLEDAAAKAKEARLRDHIERQKAMLAILSPMEAYLDMIQKDIDPKIRAILLVDKVAFTLTVGNGVLQAFLSENSDEVNVELAEKLGQFEKKFRAEITNVYTALLKA
jgi:hypothetical protein